MKKKLYIKPFCETVEVGTGNMVCMSVHDEEAPFVGAKRGFDIDDDEE